MTTAPTLSCGRLRAMITIAVASGIASVAAPAAAYETKHSDKTGAELRWTALPMKFNIHSAAATGVSAAETQAALRTSYKTWTKVACSTFDTLDQGVVNNDYGSRSDGICTNTWVSVWPAKYVANALAMTLTEYDSDTGEITDADTHYNPDRQWSTTGSPLALDIQAVATHEMGHQLGLAHPPVPGATMYYAMGKGDTAPRSLHSDDIAGICYLYPSGQPVPDECAQPDDCAPDEICDLGQCLAASWAKKGYGGPCTQPTDCLSGFCIKTAEGDTLCTQLCASEPCPNGDDCITGKTPTQTYQICKPNTVNLGQPLGSPCQTPLQCASGLCVAVSGQGDLCSQRCDVVANDCPGGYVCAPGEIGGLCVPAPDPAVDPQDPPVPAKQALGASCVDHPDCQSDLCGTTEAGKVCLQPCVLVQPAGCPAGLDCVAVAGSGTQGGCLAATVPVSVEPGAACDEVCPEGFECVGSGGKPASCQPVEGDQRGGGGCALAAAEAPDSSPLAPIWLLLLGLAVVVAKVARRRRDIVIP